MKQWVYTTSCWNIRGRSGWNTFSYTQGLSDEDIEELEQKAYVDNTLDAEYFPVYSVISLESGRQAVCRTVALGNSFYDGRRGALLTHAIIKEANESWPLPPVAYFGANVFWDKLPDDIIQRALEIRDNAKRFEPPPYLPEVPVSALTPSPRYTPEGITALLKKEPFAGNLSCMLDELEEMEEEQYPLTYTCSPAEYADYLAALCYLRPDLARKSSVVSLNRSRRASALHGIFSVAGTCDRNARMRLNGDNAELHPLVLLASSNISSAAAFFDRWSIVSGYGKQGIRRVTDILSADKPLDDSAAHIALELTRSRISFPAELELAGAAGYKILQLKECDNIIRLLNFLFSVRDDAPKHIHPGSMEEQMLQHSIAALLRHISTLVAQGVLSAANLAAHGGMSVQLCQSCLEPENLADLLYAGDSPQQCALLLQLPICFKRKIEQFGQASSDWVHHESASSLLAQVSTEEQAVQTLLIPAQASTELTLHLLDALCYVRCSADILKRAFTQHLATFNAEQICSMACSLCRKGKKQLADVFCSELLRRESGDSLLRLLNDHPIEDAALQNKLLAHALQSPLPALYSHSDAKVLLQLLEQHREDTLTPLIVNALSTGFRAHNANNHTLELAGHIYSWLEYCHLRVGEYPTIALLASLAELENTPGSEPLKEWFDTRFKPVFCTPATEPGQKPNAELRQNILKRLLSKRGADTELHLQLMNPGILPDTQELADLYVSHFRTGEAYMHLHTAPALLDALYRAGNLQLVDTLLPPLVPYLKRILHPEDFSQLKTFFEQQQREQPAPEPEMIPHIFRHFEQQKRSLVQNIFKLFFKK